ncbi:MAG: DNA repair protein RecO [Gammaproteobacteria bacterium]
MALQHAYLLHVRPYRETSVLADVFTAETGRFAAVWRGGRKSRQSLPQLFQPLMVDAQGTGELKTLRAVESAGPAQQLTGLALFSGFYLNELLVRLLPRDEAQGPLFLRYSHVLGELADGGDVESRLRLFEALLLDVLGYGLDYRHDADTGAAILPDRYYDYHPERGFFRSRRGGGGFPGMLLLQLAEGNQDSPEAMKVCKQVHRRALASLLGNRPLKSRELFLSSR